MRASEWVALAYFSYLLATAWLLRLPLRRRARVSVRAAAVIATLIGLPGLAPTPAGALVRDWAPGVYLLVGYWLPASFFTALDPAIERRLMALDVRLFEALDVPRVLARAPRALLEALELAYALCYTVPPLGLAALYAAGERVEADRFWTAVLSAGFACYGVLPLVQTRPPRALERPAIDARRVAVRRLNLRILDRASVQLNTVPSGHAATSVATALAVGATLPYAGGAIGIIAVGIVMASVVGRYHYAADAILGIVIALAAFGLSRMTG